MTETVGLLVCDHVAPELFDAFGDYPDMFEGLLAPKGFELKVFDVIAGELPDSVDRCDAWIVTGSGYSVYDDEPWIHRLRDFVGAIARSDRPYIGICFGHQMLAHALGGKVSRSERGWGVGVKTVDVVVTRPWMDPAVAAYRVVNSHADQIDSLPEESTVLAANDHCPVAMFQVGGRLLGIQGHPEFSPGFAEALIRRRRGRLVPETVADAGLSSLADTPDRDVLARWIAAFLRQGPA